MSIDWATAAVIAAASIGLVNTIDSHLIANRMPSFRSFLIPPGVLMVIFAAVIGGIYGLPSGLNGWPLVAVLTSVTLRVLAITVSLQTMRTEEVSRIIPVVYTYPIFVALVAVPLLGESLLWLDWVAIVTVVGGAVMISLRGGIGRPRLGPSFFKLMGASLMMAGADVAAKYALDYVNFWQIYWLAAAIMAVTFLGIGLRREPLRQLREMTQRNRTLILVTLNESIGLFGGVMLFFAISSGPVSLVSTINASRPFFVLLFAIIASLVVPSYGRWKGGTRTLILRVVATLMIVGGIALIYLK
jgi:drug/metabolite transporter (DMT)-like permease